MKLRTAAAAAVGALALLLLRAATTHADEFSEHPRRRPDRRPRQPVVALTTLAG